MKERFIEELLAKPKYLVQEICYRGVERILLTGLTDQVLITGRENIPQSGPLVIALAPHTGIMEVPAVNVTYERGGMAPVWATKAENFDIHPILTFLLGSRHFRLIRHAAHPDAYKKAVSILRKHGAVATALEGTRGEEQQERSSVSLSERMPLNQAYGGTVQFALRTAMSPIQPIAIWGPENEKLFPFPEKIYEEKGAIGLTKEIYKAMRSSDEKPTIHMHILPCYMEHLFDPKWGMVKPSLIYQEHAHQIMFQIIKALPDDWPLGFYEGKTINDFLTKPDTSTKNLP